MKYVNNAAFLEAIKSFKNPDLFDHCVIDSFFTNGVAEKLEKEFIEYNDNRWFHYKNAIEDKKALNDWNVFPSVTYKIFKELMSADFIELLSRLIGQEVFVDHGLHGGGWHIHASGGNLNPHLDYSIHPKLGLMRKLNIIIYVSSDLKENHGGHLGLWNQLPGKDGPNELIKEVVPKFNRAILFDTTQNSWHGMSRPLIQPEGIYRKSLAIYYLVKPQAGVDGRERAKFAPRKEQENSKEVLDLIQTRSDPTNYYKAYRGESK